MDVLYLGVFRCWWYFCCYDLRAVCLLISCGLGNAGFSIFSRIRIWQSEIRCYGLYPSVVGLRINTYKVGNLIMVNLPVISICLGNQLWLQLHLVSDFWLFRCCLRRLIYRLWTGYSKWTWSLWIFDTLWIIILFKVWEFWRRVLIGSDTAPYYFLKTLVLLVCPLLCFYMKIIYTPPKKQKTHQTIEPKNQMI